MGALFVSLIHNNPKQNKFPFAHTPNYPIIDQPHQNPKDTENQTVTITKHTQHPFQSQSTSTPFQYQHFFCVTFHYHKLNNKLCRT